MADHSLTLGSVLLTDSVPDGTNDFVFNVLADGMSFGANSPVQEVVKSLLADGDLVRITRSGNREVSFSVEITGPTLASLADGEAALRQQVGGSNTLTWQPPDALAPATVFEVVASSMVQQFDDLSELRRRRTFALTLTCSPFARSASLTSITALAPPPGTLVTATINNADTVTGWSALAYSGFGPGASSSPVTVTDQGLFVQATAITNRLGLSLTVASVSMATTRYVVVETSGTSAKLSFEMTMGGVTASYLPVASMATATGTTLYTLDAGTGSFTGITVYTAQSSKAVSQTINVHDVSRTNTIAQVANREAAAVVRLGGTERTPCSLQVNALAGELVGIGIVHTSPESGIGYSPALRPRRIAGNTVTTNSSLISGASEGVTANPIIATVPVRSLPEDGYSLVAVMRSSVVGTFPLTYSVRTAFSGNYIGGTGARVAQATFGAANTWTIVPLGNLVLPPVRASQDAFVQLDLYRTIVGAEVIELDEWWAFRMGEDCALTMVQSPRAYLWLDSPDVTSPVPRVWVGNNLDRSDAHHPAFWLINQGNHVLHPDGTTIFVAAGGIANPTVTATAYRRWHSNAAS